jgi:hypothetical protein
MMDLYIDHLFLLLLEESIKQLPIQLQMYLMIEYEGYYQHLQ